MTCRMQFAVIMTLLLIHTALHRNILECTAVEGDWTDAMMNNSVLISMLDRLHLQFVLVAIVKNLDGSSVGWLSTTLCIKDCLIQNDFIAIRFGTSGCRGRLGGGSDVD